MATQVLTKIDVESTTVFGLGDILPRSLWAPYRTAAPAFVRGSERVADGSAGDGSCFSGAFVAIALEGAVALGVYGIWLVLHLFR
jgi:hypothetical protein